jgi:DNA mismatch repair protein MutL
VEYRHIIDEFQRVLWLTQIHFTFYHNGSEMFNLLLQLYANVVTIFYGKPMKISTGSGRNRNSYHSGICKQTRICKEKSWRTVFLCQWSFIKSGYLHHAVMAAYDGILNWPVIFYIYRCLPILLISTFILLKRIKFDDEHALTLF